MDAASSKLDEYFVSSVHSSQCDKQGSAPLLWTSHLLWSTAPLASSHTHGIDLTGCKEAEFGLSSLNTAFHQTYSMLCCYSTPEIGDQSARISPQCGGTSLISSGARPKSQGISLCLQSHRNATGAVLFCSCKAEIFCFLMQAETDNPPCFGRRRRYENLPRVGSLAKCHQWDPSLPPAFPHLALVPFSKLGMD